MQSSVNVFTPSRQVDCARKNLQLTALTVLRVETQWWSHILLQTGYIKLRGKKGYLVETEWWSHLHYKRLSTERQDHLTRKKFPVRAFFFFCIEASRWCICRKNLFFFFMKLFSTGTYFFSISTSRLCPAQNTTVNQLSDNSHFFTPDLSAAVKSSTMRRVEKKGGIV